MSETENASSVPKEDPRTLTFTLDELIEFLDLVEGSEFDFNWRMKVRDAWLLMLRITDRGRDR